MKSQVYSGVHDSPVAQLALADADQTRQLGISLSSQAKPGDFIGLIGELGAGKTTMMQGVVAAIDDSDRWQATSPTYALMQVYETRPPIFHIDLYRLEGWSDLESIGYWDAVESGRGISCVEWLNRIPGAWPGRGLIVELERNANRRVARLWADDDWAQRIESLELSSPDQSANRELS